MEIEQAFASNNSLADWLSVERSLFLHQALESEFFRLHSLSLLELLSNQCIVCSIEATLHPDKITTFFTIKVICLHINVVILKRPSMTIIHLHHQTLGCSATQIPKDRFHAGIFSCFVTTVLNIFSFQVEADPRYPFHFQLPSDHHWDFFASCYF